MPDVTFPYFVFHRRRDIEVECGLILAGLLLVNEPREKKMRKKLEQTIGQIIEQLTEVVAKDPNHGLIFGWSGGRKPANAVDTSDDSIMGAWAKDRLSIEVRVDPRSDGLMRIDSDTLRQLGLIKEH